MSFSPVKTLAVSLAFAATTPVLADTSESQGFVEDSHLNLFFRTLYFNRDWHNRDARHSYSEDSGEGISARFSSGFTQSTLGFGVDAYGLLGLKFDSGRGSNASASYPVDSDGRTEDAFSKGGAALKLRLSKTVIKYGSQFVALPVLATDTGRLLPETAEGLLITSEEIDGLQLNLAHFTALSSQYKSGRDSKHLTTADAVGGRYQFSERLSGALYYSDIEDNFKKKYANLNYAFPISDTQSFTTDFNIYRSDSQGQELSGYVDNTLWSLAGTYVYGAHSFMLAYQRNSGDTGYVYGADGSAVYDFANSIQYSDFNAKNEKSWQARYDLDMTAYGVPGLSFMARYVRGDDIDNGSTDSGKEWERNLAVRYVVQNGPAKDLGLQIRHAANRSAALGSDLDELRLIVDYPLSVF